MFHAVHTVSSIISEYTANLGSDLTRNRKPPVTQEKLITFLVSQGASCSKNELLDFFDMDPQAPTASALNQQRAKLKPEALEMVFRHFNSFTDSLDGAPSDYRFIAADGSTFTFFSKPAFSPSEYYVSGGHSAKGFYSMHLNAFYDLHKHTYTDALIQPVHFKDEYKAFCSMVDRYEAVPRQKTVFTWNRDLLSLMKGVLISRWMLPLCAAIQKNFPKLQGISSLWIKRFPLTL